MVSPTEAQQMRMVSPGSQPVAEKRGRAWSSWVLTRARLVVVVVEVGGRCSRETQFFLEISSKGASSTNQEGFRTSVFFGFGDEKKCTGHSPTTKRRTESNSQENDAELRRVRAFGVQRNQSLGKRN